MDSISILICYFEWVADLQDNYRISFKRKKIPTNIYKDNQTIVKFDDKYHLKPEVLITKDKGTWKMRDSEHKYNHGSNPQKMLH